MRLKKKKSYCVHSLTFVLKKILGANGKKSNKNKSPNDIFHSFCVGLICWILNRPKSVNKSFSCDRNNKNSKKVKFMCNVPLSKKQKQRINAASSPMTKTEAPQCPTD